MMTVKEMHAGDGYAYLLRGVSDTAGMEGSVSQMTRYYAADGNPPGTWLGAGLAGLDAGRGLQAGSIVTSDQMERLYRDGADPVSGVILGRRNRVAIALADRIAMRVDALDRRLNDAERAEAVVRIEAEERAVRRPKSVSGFDFTFSVPKSVSTLWAVADAGVREQLYQAHRAALADVIRYFEQDIARTRIGTNGVARVEILGVIAAAFDHWDSRNGDPHLHTHVVVANRVQAADGRWRTLDSLGSVFPNVVALSELYNNILATQITGRLGLDWYQKSSDRLKAAPWELRGVPRRLVERFSSRRAEIQQARADLDAEYRARHQRDAGPSTGRTLDRQAWQTTRTAKTIVPLRDLLQRWASQAAETVGVDPAVWASRLTREAAQRRDAQALPLVRADDLAVGDALERLAHTALAELASSRSTWTTPNIHAAVSRATMHVRLASTTDIIEALYAATDRVEELCVDLTPAATLHTPEQYRLGDGTSAFRRNRVFTTTALLDAEARLLAAAGRLDAPTLDLDFIERYVTAPTTDGHLLAEDQAAAAAQVAVSGRVVDVLVGPAGTGKTTTLAKLTAAWQDAHGDGSVIGLAPSAVAAQVLGDSLGIPTDNTAKWLHEQHAQPERLARIERYREQGFVEAVEQLAAEHARWTVRPGSLVIVDEASLAGTMALDALRRQVSDAGGKLLLVGDPYQLSAVEAGGAFNLLVSQRDGTSPELTGVWRFHHEWERSASIQLRLGHDDVLDAYEAHDRIHSHDDAVEAAYQAWRDDEADGRTSLLIAGDNGTVAQLNQRARTDLIVEGRVEARGVHLNDGTRAGTGDRIITRQNDRTLSTGRGWVKNGDAWDVLDANRDGSLLVRRRTGGTAITLPAAYVAEHVQLGYATTAHRAQGATVDTAHLVVDPEASTLSREVLYVAMTRGRDANHVHVTTAATDDPDAAHLAHDPVDARGVLTDVLGRRSGALSATQTREHETDAQTSLARLVAEYDTIRRWATTDRYANLLRERLPDMEPTYLTEWPQILYDLRRLDAAGLPPDRVLAADCQPDMGPAQLAAALARRAVTVPPPTRRMILGVTPADVTTTDPDLRQALDERERGIRAQAQHLLAEGLQQGAPWARALPPRPAEEEHLPAWFERVESITVRHTLERRDHPLGRPHHDPAERGGPHLGL